MNRATGLTVVLVVSMSSFFHAVPVSAGTAGGIITTVAGGGAPIDGLGDGGSPTEAALYSPTGVALDGAGNLYIADMYAHRVRKVEPNGTISTVAGGGAPADGLGDGGPATQAALQSPGGVAIDRLGNLYIADTNNHRVRKVAVNGVISTLAGGGAPAEGLGDGGAATEARLDTPFGVAVDSSGNVYVADFGNSRVRKVDAEGRIATVAGGGAAADGIGDGGAATAAVLVNPAGVAVDAAGNLFIADTYNNRVRKVDAGGTITTVAGGGAESAGLGDGGPATQGVLFSPAGVAIDGLGNLYIADYWNDRLRKVDAGGIITTAAGGAVQGFSGDDGPATAASLFWPFGVAVDPRGEAYIADSGNNRIRRVNWYAPVAVAGADRTASIGSAVTLDGSGSFDPDGNYPLAYRWTIRSAPAGSAAALTGATTVAPSLAPDVAGEYVVELVVTDCTGLVGMPDRVTVGTVNSPPVADAGPDQAVTTIGQVVRLDGSGSRDVDGDPVSYSWTLVGVPPGSAAALSSPSSASPSFAADVHGDYLVRLVVNDGFADSRPDTVTVSFRNVAPVADAGASRTVATGERVYLSGAGSSDANLDPLGYSWSLVTTPAGSAATLWNASGVETGFVPDLPGQYVVSLVVNDGFVNSAPGNITVTATGAQDRLRAALRELGAALSGAALRHRNMGKPLARKLAAVGRMVDQGAWGEAFDKLSGDVLPKSDGCAAGGAPDRNDWIATCASQARVRPLILEILGLLEALR